MIVRAFKRLLGVVLVGSGLVGVHAAIFLETYKGEPLTIWDRLGLGLASILFFIFLGGYMVVNPDGLGKGLIVPTRSRDDDDGNGGNGDL